MERASNLRGKRGRSIGEVRQFQEYLHREGITLADWQARQLKLQGDADTQSLQLQRRRLQQKHLR